MSTHALHTLFLPMLGTLLAPRSPLQPRTAWCCRRAVSKRNMASAPTGLHPGAPPTILSGMEAHDELIAQAQRGDRRAMDALLVRYQQDVTRIAFRFIGPSSDLEDVVQEAFIQLFRSIGSFKGQSKFSTWLYRVVSNVAKMHLRARRVRPQLASLEAQERMRVDPIALPQEDDLDRRSRIRALYAHAAELSEKKRTVWVLHDLEGLSPAEIADIVDAPVLTVRTRLFYARRALYSALAEDALFAAVELPGRVAQTAADLEPGADLIPQRAVPSTDPKSKNPKSGNPKSTGVSRKRGNLS